MSLFNKAVIVLFLVLAMAFRLSSQPVNDNCNTSTEITIPDGGFERGVYTTEEVDMTNATVDMAEFFHSTQVSAGNDKKSVWFKFTLPTNRAIRVHLLQNLNHIPQADVGFTVYKTNSCDKLTLEEIEAAKLTPLNKFGTSYHPCLSPGDYYIQVGSKASVNSKIFMEITLDAPASQSDYDIPENAYDFGTADPIFENVFYEPGCYSLNKSNEVECFPFTNKEQFTKSSWHTFTTGNHVDYIALGFGTSNQVYVGGYRGAGSYVYELNTVVGYRLLEGDIRSSSFEDLTQIGGCDTLSFRGRISDETGFPKKEYKCSLKPNTTYTFQLVFEKDFHEEVEVFLYTKGVAEVKSPRPNLENITNENKLGILPVSSQGETTSFTDYLSCEARLSLPENKCGTVNPDSVFYNDKSYDLSTWFSFELTEPASIAISIADSFEGVDYSKARPLLARIYNKIPENCESLDEKDLAFQFLPSGNSICLTEGKYSIQLLGISKSNKDAMSYNERSPYFNNLGQPLPISITATAASNSRFSLNTSENVDKINFSNNELQPLKSYVTYRSQTDQIGCERTVLPAGFESCDPNITKGIYRVFKIGDADNDAKADSGLVYISDYNFGTYMDRKLEYKLYSGNVSNLAAGKQYSYPDTISGLKEVSSCISFSERTFCLIPGEYTIVSLGEDHHTGERDSLELSFKSVKTKFYNRENAEDLGDISSTVEKTFFSNIDYFSCLDNADTINGVAPCHRDKKAIYRQFYLDQPMNIEITDHSGSRVFYTLFKGKATDLNKELTLYSDPVGDWKCFSSKQNNSCYPLPPGWYTIVGYGGGGSYENPGSGGDVGERNRVSFAVSPYDGPKFNRPHKAYDNNAPFTYLGSVDGSNSMYTRYSLPKEVFGCQPDTPFSTHPFVPCDTSYTNVAYYTFTLDHQAFVRVVNVDLYTFKTMVFPFSVKTDSTKMVSVSPIQPCIENVGRHSNDDDNYIQLCDLPPGTYTLVILAKKGGYSNRNLEVEPRLQISPVGTSRFDFAQNAYDFGVIPADGTWQNGKQGDTHPDDPSKTPSSDFFYCTTGSFETDPSDALCNRYSFFSNPNVYKDDINALYTDVENFSYTRRNLWYTFVSEGPGTVSVKVNTPNVRQVAFAVYESDEDGSVPFNTLVASGKVDSTASQGLTLVADNKSYRGGCGRNDSIGFYKGSCSKPLRRYYVIVENQYSSSDLYPNLEVDVAVSFEPGENSEKSYDHFTEANVINGLGETDAPYTSVPLTNGIYRGAPSSFGCATIAKTDKGCNSGNRTIWYKFDIANGGNLTLSIEADGELIPYDKNFSRLFKVKIPGDSTYRGLTDLAGNCNRSLPTINEDNTTKASVCVEPGTYYLMLNNIHKGINKEFGMETIVPVLNFTEQEGDVCAKTIDLAVEGQGSASSTAIVTCHSMGGDFGEDGLNMGCLSGPYGHKSTWFKVEVKGSEKLDLTFKISENTSAQASRIQYRILYGECDAMTSGPCNTDALTEFTLNCMKPGNYFVQVVSPLNAEGDITLNVESIPTPDQNCLGLDPLEPVANFEYTSHCDSDSDSVSFINQSTLGEKVSYLWDFDYEGETSTEVHPKFTYPRNDTIQVFNVRLVVENTYNHKKDTVSIPVYVLPVTEGILGNDTTLCDGDTISFDISSPGYSFSWSDGSSSSLKNISDPGIYWVELKSQFCEVRDSIEIETKASPYVDLGNDTTLCEKTSLTLDVSTESATYKWQDYSESPIYMVKENGVYWVDVTKDKCTTRDSIEVTFIPQKSIEAGADTSVCITDDPFALTGYSPEGGTWAGPGISEQDIFTASEAGQGIHKLYYSFNNSTCSAKDSIKIEVNTLPEIDLGKDTTICESETLILRANGSGSIIWNNGATDNELEVTQEGKYWIEVETGACKVRDSIEVRQVSFTDFSAGDDDTICIDQSPLILVGKNPSDGIWSGEGVVKDSLFDPGIAGIGSHKIAYTGTKGACSKTIYKNIEVTALPAVVAGQDTSVCADLPAFELSSYSPSGGEWTGTGIDPDSEDHFDPGLAAIGTHDIFYTYSDGFCTASASKEITVVPIPLVDAGPNENFCLEDPAKPLNSFSPSGGVWSGTGVSQEGIFNPEEALAGKHLLSYSVTINGCTKEAVKEVEVSPIPPIPSFNDTTICINSALIDLSLTENSSEIWTGPGVLGNNLLNPATAGEGVHSYTVEITENNCTGSANRDISVVAKPSVPDITLSGPSTFCIGEKVSLEVLTEPGFQPQWILDGVVIDTATGNTIFPVKTGEYSVRVTSTCGTVHSNSVQVKVLTSPTPSVLENERCGPGKVRLVLTNGNDGNFNWYDPEKNTIPGENNSVYETPYIDKSLVYYASVIDDNCESERIPVKAIVHPLPYVDAGVDVVLKQGESIVLSGYGDGIFNWEPAKGLDNPSIKNPTASPEKTTTYHFEVTDPNGCKSVDSVEVKVIGELSIPNSFTPNGDGTNDVWNIGEIEGYPACEVEIFNRWGSKIFSSKGYNTPWDGREKGKELPVGTYFYKISLTKDKDPIVGHVSIIR